MAAIEIPVRDIIELKFKSYLDTLDTAKQEAFIEDMVGTPDVPSITANAVTAQVAELSGQFESLMKQVPAFIQSTATEAGNAAAIVANSANPMAATASVSMLISLAAAIQNLMATFNGLKTAYDGFMAGVDKLGVASIVAPVIAPLTALMGGMPDPEKAIPTPPEPVFKLTVESGSGSGDYVRDTKVDIAADEVDGFIFTEWASDVQDVVIEDILSSTTVLTMPISAVTVTANYQEVS